MLTTRNPTKRGVNDRNSWMIYKVTHAEEREAACYNCQSLLQM